MLFNSYPFIFAFCPIVFGILFLIPRSWKQYRLVWLITASLFFYGWWNPRYLILILSSLTLNFGFARLLAVPMARRRSKTILSVAVTINLLLLGYYKYFIFFATQWSLLTDSGRIFQAIILPLGISFFTFQQISFLIDTYHQRIPKYGLLEYVFVVTFFPHLIAGPIVRHSEIMPEIRASDHFQFRWQNLAFGFTLFALGLAKKTLLADSLAPIANMLFDSQAPGAFPIFSAWKSVIAYTLQIYFDFSGYSDMAIGLARVAGIRFPINFYSPYQATSIIEFWRRWHISLSRFLRDYLYISLGGNRLGKRRRYANLIITMVLGGLWHGAGWTFIIWGGLHGVYLILNHGWRSLTLSFPRRLPRIFSQTLTLVAVAVAWVYFRSADVSIANKIVTALFSAVPSSVPFRWSSEESIVLSTLLLALFMPNLYDWMRHYSVVVDSEGVSSKPRLKKWEWKPNALWASYTALAFVVGVSLIYRSKIFLYFQF